MSHGGPLYFHLNNIPIGTDEEVPGLTVTPLHAPTPVDDMEIGAPSDPFSINFPLSCIVIPTLGPNKNCVPGSTTIVWLGVMTKSVSILNIRFIYSKRLLTYKE